MAKTLSYEHALNTIRLVYGKLGFVVDDHTLGKQVYAEFNMKVAESRLGALYAFVDEQLALLRMVSWYFTSGLTNAQSSGRAHVFYGLTVTHMRTLASIRILCSAGLDVNARHELRKLYENALLWVRLRIDTAALEEFRKAQTAEASNGFWHKYLSREKTEKYLADALQDRYSWLGDWPEGLEDLKQKVGPAAHPSFYALMFDARQDFQDTVHKLVLGEPHQSSHFTLSMAILCAAMPFSLKPEPPYGIACEDFLKLGHPFNCISHSSNSWEEYSARIRDMIMALQLMANRFIEHLRDKDSGDPILEMTMP